MTLNEFKAWLEGFDTAIQDSPTPEQWMKIKEKLKTVEVINSYYPKYRSPSIDVPLPLPITC